MCVFTYAYSFINTSSHISYIHAHTDSHSDMERKLGMDELEPEVKEQPSSGQGKMDTSSSSSSSSTTAAAAAPGKTDYVWV
jgi:hypothetical protein